MNLKNKKIILMGLGLHGGGVGDALFFIKNGARLIITDLRTEKELKLSINKINKFLSTTGKSDFPVVEWILGQHREEDFKNSDLIIKNPAVPNESRYLKIAQSAGVPIRSSTGIFFEFIDRKKIIGVTGTKGKSTTAQLLYEIIKTEHPNTYIAGVPGVSPLSLVDFSDNIDFVILELSSWDLQDIEHHKKSPHIALILNIQEDHLNRHKDFNDYKNSKKIIFKYQTKDDYLILNKKNQYFEEIKKEAKSKIVSFSVKQNEATWIPESLFTENVLAALITANILNISTESAVSVAKKFRGLTGRLELVGKIKDVKIYNDATATNPYATLRGIERFLPKKIALIVGGEDKNLDYSKLSKKLHKLHFVALLPGSASDKIHSWSGKHKTWNKNFQKVENLQDAVKKCLDSKPEIILFSPAAASFNMFKNEFDRGEKFKKTVKKLENELS